MTPTAQAPQRPSMSQRGSWGSRGRRSAARTTCNCLGVFINTYQVYFMPGHHECTFPEADRTHMPQRRMAPSLAIILRHAHSLGLKDDHLELFEDLRMTLLDVRGDPTLGDQFSDVNAKF